MSDRQEFREFVEQNDMVEELYDGDRETAIETAVTNYCAQNDIHGQGAQMIGGFAPHVVDDIYGGEPTSVWSCPTLGHSQKVVVEEQPTCHECHNSMEKVGESNA